MSSVANSGIDMYDLFYDDKGFAAGNLTEFENV